jgi:hypothetical protein
MDDLKVRLVDSTFSLWSKSASLRKENADVYPTHFKWTPGDDYTPGMPFFYTDNAILTGEDFGENAIAWLLEPRCLRPENYEAAKAKAHLFKAVLSYDIEFLKGIPNGRWYALGGSSISFDKWGVYPKAKDVCMFVSAKRTTEGHRLRHEIMEKFGDRIDCYGEGAGRPVKSKFEVLKDYRYCVVVESCNILAYFTEKLIDCISVGTIPIYWGTGDIIRIFRIGALCWFYSLAGMKDLIKTIYQSKEYDNLLYRAVGEQIESNLESAKKFRICEDWIYENHKDLFT